MLSPSVSNIGQPAATSAKPANDLGQKDIFLKLLVAQMEYQDPLNPQDATAMSSQLAQFNMVEQQTESNKLLKQLVGAGGNAGPQAASGADYLGHTVSVNQDQLYYDGTAQNFSAVLDEPSPAALVYIFNSAGEPVKTMSATNLSAGINQLSWDGTTDSGAQAPQDFYTIGVSAFNLNGEAVNSSIQRSGIVEAVRFTSNGTELMVGGVAASPDEITEIRL